MFPLESRGLLHSGVAKSPLSAFGRGHTITLRMSRLLCTGMAVAGMRLWEESGQAPWDSTGNGGSSSTSGDRALLEEAEEPPGCLNAGPQLCPLMGPPWLGPQPAILRHPSSPLSGHSTAPILPALHRISLSDRISGDRWTLSQTMCFLQKLLMTRPTEAQVQGRAC